MGTKAAGQFIFFNILLSIISCSNNTNEVEIVQPKNSAFIRTLNFVNSDIDLNDLDSTFGVNLEVEDGNGGGLLESIEVFAQFNDNTAGSINSSSQEVLVKTLGQTEFSAGPDGLPRVLLSLTHAELNAATGINNSLCGDQFLIRLKLNLTNGESFSTARGNTPAVIGFDTTISSPFSYTLHIVDSLPDEQFIGLYTYESIADGLLGPTFGSPKVVELKRGNSANDRYFEGDYIASRSNEPSRKFRFIFTCCEVVFRKNQISSFFTWCPEGNLAGGITFGGSPILLGPGEETGIISENDDSFFELSISEGYQGWDGECGLGTMNAKVRFTKMEQ